MFGDIKAFYDMAVDKSQSLGTRVATVITIVALIFIFDCVTNFTYNIFISNKLSNLEAVNNLKSVYQSDSIHFKEFLKIEKNLLERKHYFVDRFLPQVSKIDIRPQSISQYRDKQDTIIGTSKRSIQTKSNNSINSPIRSNIWMVLSSSYLLVLTLFIFFFVPLFTKEKRNYMFFMGWFASIVILSLIIVFITWTAYQIPIINNNPLWNYLLNSLIHLLFIIAVVKIYRNKP